MKPLLLVLTALLFAPALYAAPNLILAKEYNGQNIAGWAMSEKLDGVRAYWDGRKLISRQGHPFSPPAGFTRDFPPYPLDGELYSRRGAFEQISAAVRSANGDWSGIKLHVFDAPQAPATCISVLPSCSATSPPTRRPKSPLFRKPPCAMPPMPNNSCAKSKPKAAKA